jgi:hypothetical protein
MVSKILPSAEAAVADIHDGAAVMTGERCSYPLTGLQRVAAATLLPLEAAQGRPLSSV